MYVIKAGTAFEQLAVNPLGEVAMATPAISEGTMFFRTRGHLVAVREKPLSGRASRLTRGAESPESAPRASLQSLVRLVIAECRACCRP